VAGLAVVGSLALLLVAMAVAAVVVLRGGHKPPVATEPGAAPDVQGGVTAKDEFEWLATAMKDCEAAAAQNADTLRFLIIPLASAAGDEERWRAKSINDVGNGILLSSDTALDALRSRSLNISAGEFDFRMRDEGTQTVYKWKPATGVANFSTADADKITTFRLQFQTADHAGNDDWGAAFRRQKGTCYWVNAIIGH
jgi:hypothetical protein